MTSLDNQYFKNIINIKKYEKDSVKYFIDKNFGSGFFENFNVMPGIELIYIDVQLNKSFDNMMTLNEDCIEITYCLNGQVEIKLVNERYNFMGDGDICLFAYQTKAVSCDFVSPEFKGIKIMIYLEKFIPALNEMLSTNEFKKSTFFQNVFNADRCIISHGNQSLNHIFKELYVLPDKHKKYLMKIKVVELLLYLVEGNDYKKNENVYFSRESVEKIKYARKIILENYDRFITIKELAQTVGINTTDLEKGFKSLYGTTVFACGKMNKMMKAKELLQDDKLSILDISLAVGYSNGGKFAKAFKNAFGMLPTEYRKENCLKNSKK